MPKVVKIVSTAFLALGTSAWALAKLMLDIVGATTFPEDARGATIMTRELFAWLLTTPGWVPGLLATAFSLVFLFFVLKGERSKNDRLGIKNPDELQEVRNQKFYSVTVELDGFRYINCTFSDVTFKWNGGLFQVIDPSWENGWAFITTNNLVTRALEVFRWLKLGDENVQMRKIKVGDFKGEGDRN